MATIYPSVPEPGIPRAERTVFEYLRDGLPSDWIVVHGQRFVLPRDRGHPDEGEVDFVVLDPNRGMVVLEVKGGTIGQDADGWYSIDIGGRDRHRIKDPGRQSQSGAHKLGHYLRDSARTLRELSYGWGVVFPDVEIEDESDFGPELPASLVVARSHLADPEASVGRIFHESGVDGPRLDPDAVRAFTNTVLPRFQLVPSVEPLSRPSRPLAERIAAEERQLVRLTEAQMRILDFNRRATRLAVEGGAGTGKTLVALERARRLAEEGNRVLLLCYNSALAKALGKETGETLDAWSFHGLCRDAAIEAGLGFDPPPGDSEFWENDAPELLMQALDLLPDRRWDAVIVDEGQDFADHWWPVVLELLRDPDEGTLWVFHDPAQNIFGRESWTEIDHMQAADLPTNCRNTQAIGRHAYGSLGLEPSFLPDAPEGLDVQDIECADEAQMVDEVRKAIHRLLVEERLDHTSLVVLSTRAEHSSAVWREREFGNYTLAAHPATEPNTVGFATLQRFKGLEAEAVVLCEIASGEPHSTPNHVYVGASRAKHALVVLRYPT